MSRNSLASVVFPLDEHPLMPTMTARRFSMMRVHWRFTHQVVNGSLLSMTKIWKSLPKHLSNG